MRQYRNELVVAPYLSSLNPKLSSQIRRQILNVDTVLYLHTIFSKVLRISTTPVPVSDWSVLATTCGRGMAKEGGRTDGGATSL